MNECSVENKKLIHRINRIEGQVKALKIKLIDDINCKDEKNPYEIIRQLRAIKGAINGMINSYIQHFSAHLVREIREAEDEATALAKMDALLETIKHGMK
jgi:DNA-binding FrmR family transcriptional regulator